jgi:tetratricopeptide (TPR) repeat protein
LYIGVAWIVLQGADVLLPAFEAPAWVFRALVITALAGAPLTAVLAWIYEYTERGIKRQESVEVDHSSRTQGRQMDFIVIGVLVLALSFSIYLNVQKEPASPLALDPVSILIADFDNQTGDPVFDDVLEMALTVGLEGAPFIMVYRRNKAAEIAAMLKDGTDGLDVEAARSVSVQEGIKFVLSGTIQPKGPAYALSVIVLNPSDSEVIAEASASAKNKSEIFGGVGSLAGQIRAALGDISVSSGELPLSETFTAASLEAASDYSKAQSLVSKSRFDESTDFYQRAIDADPIFGRAFAGYTFALFRLGQIEEAEAMWPKVEFSLETMTEREKLRALALYYVAIAQNTLLAKDTYERLAELYPADNIALNNLAVTYFNELDFQRAQEAASRVVEIYPKDAIYRRNLAQFAMHAGDIDTAISEAQELLEDQPGHYMPYLVLAMAAMAAGDAELAVSHYRRMAETNGFGESLATLGLADTAIYTGKFAEAAMLLTDGIGRDRDAGMTRGLASMAIALASARAMEGSPGPAQEAIEEALEQSRSEGTLFPAAHLLIQLGQVEDAADLAAELGDKLQLHPRAYGRLVEGMVAMAEGDSVAAIKLVKQSIDLTDLWLGRFHLGIIYLKADYAAEALSQFELCEARIAEASSLFLDDMPTWRYAATLMYWKARAHEAIDMRTPAVKGYQAFLVLRPAPTDDPLAMDARRRMTALTAE